MEADGVLRVYVLGGNCCTFNYIITPPRFPQQNSAPLGHLFLSTVSVLNPMQRQAFDDVAFVSHRLGEWTDELLKLVFVHQQVLHH